MKDARSQQLPKDQVAKTIQKRERRELIDTVLGGVGALAGLAFAFIALFVRENDYTGVLIGMGVFLVSARLIHTDHLMRFLPGQR